MADRIPDQPADNSTDTEPAETTPVPAAVADTKPAVHEAGIASSEPAAEGDSYEDTVAKEDAAAKAVDEVKPAAKGETKPVAKPPLNQKQIDSLLALTKSEFSSNQPPGKSRKLIIFIVLQVLLFLILLAASHFVKF
jgi:hypothetical protein